MKPRMSRSEVVGIGCALLSAIDALSSGKADETDIGTIVYAANISLMFAELGLGAEYTRQITAGQEAAAVAAHMHRNGEQMQVHGVDALRRLAEIHIAQLESRSCTWRLIRDAQQRMKQRAAAGEVIEVKETA